MSAEQSTIRPPNWFRIFVIGAGAILALTGCAKILAALGSAQILEMQDELLMLRNRDLMFGMGLLEIAIAGVLCRGRDNLFSAMILIWLNANFVLYRIALLFTKTAICPCLGHIHQALHLSPEMVDTVLKLIICFNMTGAFLIAYHYRRHLRETVNSFAAVRYFRNSKGTGTPLSVHEIGNSANKLT
jgi:hypothetical protein